MLPSELPNLVMLAGMGVMAVLIGLCLIRAVRGPRLTDRIVAVNMICTFVVISICMAAYYLQETFLIDIAILYALLNLATVAILTRVVVSHKREKQEKSGKEHQP
jgi:multicomponent Na+:H+ antiporter subunit F